MKRSDLQNGDELKTFVEDEYVYKDGRLVYSEIIDYPVTDWDENLKNRDSECDIAVVIRDNEEIFRAPSRMSDEDLLIEIKSEMKNEVCKAIDTLDLARKIRVGDKQQFNILEHTLAVNPYYNKILKWITDDFFNSDGVEVLKGVDVNGSPAAIAQVKHIMSEYDKLATENGYLKKEWQELLNLMKRNVKKGKNPTSASVVKYMKKRGE